MSRGAPVSMTRLALALPVCTLVAEASRLDVGRGVAVEELVATVLPSASGCTLDTRASLLAREEGRAPPDLVALRITIDGREVAVGGPHGRAVVDVPKQGGLVRVVAALRGDRFIAPPLSTDKALRGGKVSHRAVTKSVWGPHTIYGVARWIEVGVPIVIAVDPSRDREPSLLTQTVSDPVSAIVVDAGPVGSGDSTSETRARDLARGGAAALSVLLNDLPVAIATAEDTPRALVALNEAARAARAASMSTDPIVITIGQRLATAIATGFTSCRRVLDPALGETLMPPRWPTPLRELLTTGVLEDADAACPRVDDLLATNHPDVRFAREGMHALSAAMTAALPTIGPIATASRPRPPARVWRRARRVTAVLVAVVLTAAAGFVVRLPSRVRAR